MPAGGRDRLIALTPNAADDGHPAIDAALVEAEEKDRACKVPPQFGSVEEIEAWRQTKEYRRFVGEA